MSTPVNNNSSHNPNDEKEVGYRLDPVDWDEYRAQMHQLVDECCDRMKAYRDLPWKPPPADLPQQVTLASGGDNETTKSS